MHDVLVVGVGPAGAAITAALAELGLRVAAMAPTDPETPWRNTYGVWCDELAPGLQAVLGHRWSNVVVYAGEQELRVGREYGLFDNARLQAHFLEVCARGGVTWHRGSAVQIDQRPTHSRVISRDGATLEARLVVDASGHTPSLLRRPAAAALARQAAYGVVGTFSRPPVADGQVLLMDYRAEHLTPAERAEPPTFLYAMDLGEGRYFVEETSLAHVPGVPLARLEQRLHRRLAAMGVAVREVEHVERCLFPMNAPLPDLRQPVAGFGGAASMVHPPTGYLVGGALRRAPAVARAIGAALDAAGATPPSAAHAAWEALWPRERLRRRQLYLFGLASLMRCDTAQTQGFFGAFFRLPRPLWTGYLSDTLSTAGLVRAMLLLFGSVPGGVRRTLALAAGRERELLRRAALGRA